VSGLRKRVVQGVLWRSGVGGGEHVLRILFTIVLARLLTQHDFGLVAMALVVTRFVQAITQVPFGGAIIRDRDVSDAQITAILIYQVGVNLVVSLGCCLAAPAAAAFFGEAQLTPIIAVLAWSLFISSLSFPTILLRKRMEFGRYSALELASMLVANGLAVAAAFAGLGVWALVIRVMADRLFFAVAVWWIVRWRPVRPSFRGIAAHVRFGLHLLGSNICEYVSQNLVAILIGKFAGAGTLGCFTIAFNLTMAAAAQVQAVLTIVLTPAFALLQGDRRSLARKAYESMFTLGVLYIPCLLGIAAVARSFVVVAYGKGWERSGDFLMVLAGAALLKGLEHLLRSVLIATGRSASILRITAAQGASAVLFVAIGGHFWGADGFVWAYLASGTVSFLLSLREAQSAVGSDVFLRAIGRSLAAAGLMAATVTSVTFLTPWRQGTTLLVQILLGMLLYVLLRTRAFSREELALVRTWPVAGPMLARR
jgi:O-antigen/teichoic acid export membrane protein